MHTPCTCFPQTNLYSEAIGVMLACVRAAAGRLYVVRVRPERLGRMRDDALVPPPAGF